MPKSRKRPISPSLLYYPSDAEDDPLPPTDDHEAEASCSGESIGKKSKHPGVYWYKANRKWRGAICDTSVRVGKKATQSYTTYFDDEQACIEATEALRAEVEDGKAKKLHAMAQDLEHTQDLPPCPPNPADAEEKTAYYGEARFAEKGAEAYEFRPERFVRVKAGKRGFKYQAGCRHGVGKDACGQLALNGHYCINHGGGFRRGEAAANLCSFCCFTEIKCNRQLRHGGNGLCSGCEERKKQDAAENGHDGPPSSKRWEEVVFDMLEPQVTYADGTPFSPDQRDERKGGGLGTSKAVKRRRECATTTNRFPDGLWLRRDKHARIILAVSPENDEHSHENVTNSECESGKIDDTFQAIQNIAATEGAARGAACRADAHMVPIVVIRFNPNAYDGGLVPLKVRVAALARLMNHYLQMPEEDVAKLQTNAPIVHVLYYHSKQGGSHLAHYEEVAPRAGWDFHVHDAKGESNNPKFRFLNACTTPTTL